MAGGYRCSLGHTWNPTDGVAATACPVCGDTTVVLIAVLDEPPLYVFAADADPSSGQAATQSIAVPQVAVVAPDDAPTVAFAPPDPPHTTDTPDPSFSSLVVLLPESGDSGESASSVVPFGVAETLDFAPPLVPGYEIVHEVGRGGMGVVYKARQVSLNRLVALKMILSGAHAGPNERERFKREAEAVAALQHAHIVQIFDIGEANGHPYLALEFVDGGSLAQHLTGEPWTATRAAELIEVLARTMQFAHDAGIVHRDLKPGNILLVVGGGQQAVGSEDKSKTGRSSCSLLTAHCPLLTPRPKITDFGLAKRLDETLGDAGTRTGSVMGTPSYIAPEQASGKTHDVGPSVDVYALGAILYELLTGRPPFRGETPLDTVLQVLHDDPVPPKRLHPLVPRDLETICLKCLSKQSAKRYASAAALANDLGRFRRGEPIKARPLSAWGRGVKWARRHPALAVLLGVTVTATVALVTVLSVAYAHVRDAVRDKEQQARVAEQERDGAKLQKAIAETEKKRAEDLAAENDKRRIEAARRLRAPARPSGDPVRPRPAPCGRASGRRDAVPQKPPRLHLALPPPAVSAGRPRVPGPRPGRPAAGGRVLAGRHARRDRRRRGHDPRVGPAHRPHLGRTRGPHRHRPRPRF
jgi:serine/threonine protein kinase